MKHIDHYLALSLMCWVSVAHGFNLETHALITSEALNRSVINTPDLQMRYGFERLDQKDPFNNKYEVPCGAVDSSAVVFRNGYIDASPNWLTVPGANPFSNAFGRCSTLYEQYSMPPTYTGLLPANLTTAVGSTAWLRLEGWLMRGAIREDDYAYLYYDNPALRPDQDPWSDSFRSINHFYDPINNLTGLGPLSNIGKRSTAWALGVDDTPDWQITQLPDAARGNHFSYADARKLMFLALTYKETLGVANERLDSQLRTNIWATMFKSLGHVVHLLQDTASPQHVRGEPHGYLCNGASDVEVAFFGDVATRTFENYTNFRVTYPFDLDLVRAGVDKRYSFSNFCDDAKWRQMFEEGGQSPPAATARWTSTNTYPIPQFSVQRKFFTTRVDDSNINARRGLADYTNRGFFTEGVFRNGGNEFASPPREVAEYTPGISRTETIPDVGVLETQALLWRVPDAVAPNYADPNLVDGKAPIVSRTLWEDPEVFNGGVGTLLNGNLSLNNYNQIADMTVARTVAYTAGFFNFFFRGKLEIETIPQRIFAVINQGEPHTMDGSGYPIRTSNGKVFGFTKIRLKVRNITDPIIESGTGANVPQRVGVGKLVAVARYHRNACYKADLTGERQLRYSPPPTLLVDEPTCPANLPTRTNYQEISVSAPQDILSDADLPGGTGVTPASLEKVFDFSMDPIPVNATDLFIQVVYRGQLGAETDGIAVGNYDLREPTFYAGWNNTDYLHNENNGLWQNAGGAFPARAMQGIRICAGTPSKWVYQYEFTDAQPGLSFPFTG